MRSAVGAVRSWRGPHWQFPCRRNGMKSMFATACAIVFFLCPVVSMADSPDVLICPDDGCAIVTCSADECSIWVCRDGDCQIEVTFPNPNPGGSGASGDQVASFTPEGESNYDSNKSLSHKSGDAKKVLPLYGPVGGLHCRQERCTVKTCSDFECSLIGFDNGRAIMLGKFDNNDEVIHKIAEDFTKSEPDSINEPR